MTTPVDGIARSRVADQIIEELRHRILSGTYPRGSKLPPEKVLAAEFRVSAPTIREALRALTSLGLVTVRHGSGAYVRTDSDGILRGPLGMLVQLESVGVEEMLGLMRVLILHALDLAVDAATEDDIRRVRLAAERTETAEALEAVYSAGSEFLAALSAASHQPLLDALCSFLANLLFRLEIAVYRRHDPELWRKWTHETAPMRFEIAEALEARDRPRLLDGFRELQEHVSERVRSVPELREARMSDPSLMPLVSDYLFGA